MEGGKERQGSVKKKRIVVGPWGGLGGNSWDDGTYDGVEKSHSFMIVASIPSVWCMIRMVSPSQQKSMEAMEALERIKLEYPEEVLVSVSGHYCPVLYGGTPVIRSLTLKSNKRTFGPYGVEEGTQFNVPMDGGVIVGLKGRGAWHLDAIEVRLSRVQSANLIERVQKSLRKARQHCLSGHFQE